MKGKPPWPCCTPHPPFGDLTYYPTSRRIRGTRGKDTIVDSRRAVLV
jgi:hypothetical protein